MLCSVATAPRALQEPAPAAFAGTPPTALERAWRTADSLCIRCGFCLPVCPTYRLTGAESASPRGRLDLMYAAAQGRLPVGEIDDALGLCLGCLACQTACPAGIAFGDMLEAGQADLAATRRPPALQRLALGPLLGSRGLLRAVAWALYAYQRSGLQALARSLRLTRLAGARLARLERRMPPLPAPRSWRPRARRQGLVERDGARLAGDDADVAALLTGCVMDALYGRVHLATVEVLRHNGYRVLAPTGQTCCGALQLHAGDAPRARARARRNIAAFGEGRGPIVVDSAGCGALMKDYGRLLADDSAWAERARRFAARVRDVHELLAGDGLAPPPHPVPLRVAYDDACHLLHGQKIGQAPRDLLRQVPGLELVPLKEADWCCGSAGSYSLARPDMAARVLERKMGHVAASGAEVLASGNPGCLLQLALGVREAGLPVRVVHPVELLARAYRGGGDPA